MESVSLTVTKDAPRYVNASVTDREPAAYIPMIETAEIVAQRYGITRAAQDAYGAESQQRAARGLETGAFVEEIAPITVEKALFDKAGTRTGSETVTLAQDEGIRPGTTLEALSGLKTVWPGGEFTGPGETITAGNASQLSDGASAQIVMDHATAKAEGRDVLGLYRGFQAAGCAPDEMGIGPVFAIPKLLARAGLSVADIGLWERGVRVAMPLLPRYARDRSGKVQRQRRRDRDRASVRDDRVAARRACADRGAEARGTLGRGVDVHRWRDGRGGVVRDRLTGIPAGTIPPRSF